MPTLKIEHVAFNVAQPAAMAAWYVAHLGLSIVRRLETPPFTHFLRDERGSVLVEIYNNPSAAVPNYFAINPLVLHLAFVSDDPTDDQQALQSAGATTVDEQQLADGSHLIMLRDPWGLAIQLCKRGTPMIV